MGNLSHDREDLIGQSDGFDIFEIWGIHMTIKRSMLAAVKPDGLPATLYFPVRRLQRRPTIPTDDHHLKGLTSNAITAEVFG
ncbi:MAG: hypothetical protein QM692_20485 [Thermomicrobiales bacterium]